MKAKVKLSQVASGNKGKCSNANCTCENCNCGDNCTCKDCK